MNIIGLDLGTTSISAAVLDSESGAVLETVNLPSGADLPPRQAFERIQDPDAIAGKALGAVAALREKYPAAAIGIDGQMHGMLYVDREGRAVSPLFTWQDQRGVEALGDTSYAGELSRRTGHPLATGYGMVTHFWHVVNRRVPEAAAKLCTVYDYVGMKLTGRATPLMHISSAASLGLANAALGDWDRKALARAGLDAGILPEVTDQCAILGHTPDGIPVACGLGDNQASFIGSMKDMAGGVLVNMGTGGQVSMLTSARSAGGELEVRPLGGGRAIVVGSLLCGGRGYALLERFLRSCAKLAGAGDVPLFEAMNQAGLALLSDADPLHVDTRFNGTRTRPELRGSISGIGTENFDAGHLVAGTLLGMAREAHGLYADMVAGGAAPATHLVGSGNGIRRNPALRRAFESVFGMEMRIPAHGEEAAFGAALFAMAAAGLAGSLEQAQRMIHYL